MSVLDRFKKSFKVGGDAVAKKFKSTKAGYENFFGTNEKQVKEDQARIDQQNRERLDRSRGVLDSMAQADRDYQSSYKTSAEDYLRRSEGYGNEYLARQDGLRQQAAEQAKNAQATYSNDIQPNQKRLMEDAMRNAGKAMSLQDAMNPNNKVAQRVRDLYNDEGETIRSQGLQDAGVLAALGAQATAGQMGGMQAFTGSNLANISAQNQRQSSEAFAAAQKRMQDLREQGLGRSLDQSNWAYEQGQQAQDRAAGRVNEYEMGNYRHQENQRGYRDELSGYDADRLGVQRGMAGERFDLNRGYSDLAHGLAMGQGQRQLGIYGDEASSNIASIQNAANQRANIGAERRKLLFDQPAAFGSSIVGKGGGAQMSKSETTRPGGPTPENSGVSANMYSGGQYGPPTFNQYQEEERRRYGRG